MAATRAWSTTVGFAGGAVSGKSEAAFFMRSSAHEVAQVCFPFRTPDISP